jgi:hypothetical protein
MPSIMVKIRTPNPNVTEPTAVIPPGTCCFHDEASAKRGVWSEKRAQTVLFVQDKYHPSKERQQADKEIKKIRQR